MVRSLTIALLLITLPIDAPVLAQSKCPPDCPPAKLVPISGRVVSAVDGHPIAGAAVRYRAEGSAERIKNGPIAPALAGVVMAGADGSYTLPELPSGDITIRVVAPGFLGDQRVLREQPAGHKLSAVPAKPPVCITTAEQSSCSAPREPDGVFRLYRDPLELRAMPDASLAVFNLPSDFNPTRRFLTAAFSPDGESFALLTLDSVSLPGQSKVTLPPFLRCVVWIYALGTERLTGTHGLEPSVCEGMNARMSWSVDGFYIVYRVGKSLPAIEQVVQVSAGETASRAYDSLPVSVQASLATRGPQSAAEKQGLEPQITNDGRFSVQWRPDQGCGPLMVTLKNSDREQAVTMGCEDLSFMLDPERDLLFYNESLLTDNAGYNFGKITEAYLQTGRRRSFRVPVIKHAPQLLAWQPLGSGAVRIAYGMDGDCDGAATDYAQPDQVNEGRGETPNQSSVCFITIPPLPSHTPSAQ